MQYPKSVCQAEETPHRESKHNHNVQASNRFSNKSSIPRLCCPENASTCAKQSFSQHQTNILGSENSHFTADELTRWVLSDLRYGHA